MQKSRQHQSRTPSVSRPNSPAANQPSSPHPDTTISADEIVVPGSTILDPGTVAGTTTEENMAPEQQQHHDGADTSAPMIEDTPEASKLGEEETPAKTSVEAEQQQQEQQQQQQQQSSEPSGGKSAGTLKKKQKVDTPPPKPTPTQRTVLPTSSPQPEPNLLEMKLTMMDILQRSSPRPATTSAGLRATYRRDHRAARRCSNSVGWQYNCSG